MAETRLAVAGLKEFRKGLKSLDKDLPKGLRIMLNTVADVVVQGAKPKIPKRSGAAAGSLRASSSQTEARITAGGRRAPYYPWLDFGGRVGRNRSVQRRFIKGGRYIYPTVAAKQKEIQAAMLKAVTQTASASGIRVD